MNSLLEEKFLEAASLGDLKCLMSLVNQNIDINSQNTVNGWTALHWACRRGHNTCVEFLLSQGANPKICDRKGRTPKDVTYSNSILKLLGSDEQIRERNNIEESGFVPNYLVNPPLLSDIVNSMESNSNKAMKLTPVNSYSSNNNLVLRVRESLSSDPDFIEIELPPQNSSYAYLKTLCCKELGVNEISVERIRKLPNTRLRNDNDVKRLKDYDSLEIVVPDISTKIFY